MKIYYHRFKIHPKKNLNRLSGLSGREGVFLFSESKTGIRLAEYFPHPEFGDDNIDVFLSKFHENNHSYYQKVKHTLSYDIEDLPIKPFLNHQLWKSDENIHTRIIKYKIHDVLDLKFLEILSKIDLIRIDANGIFNLETIAEFFAKIPREYHSKIDYIEDPMPVLNWMNLPFKTARDFLPATTFDYLIFKPSRSIFKDISKKIIFSGNMGHIVGQYHDCKELLEKSDLSLYHGIITNGIYHDVPELFVRQTESDLFNFSNSTFKSLINDLQKRDWSFLCQLA